MNRDWYNMPRKAINLSKKNVQKSSQFAQISSETSTQVLVIAMEGFDGYGLDIGSKLRKNKINTEVMFGLKEMKQEKIRQKQLIGYK